MYKQDVLEKNITKVLEQSTETGDIVRNLSTMINDKFLFVEKDEFDLEVLENYRNRKVFNILKCIQDEESSDIYSWDKHGLKYYLQANENILFHYLIGDICDKELVLKENVLSYY